MGNERAAAPGPKRRRAKSVAKSLSPKLPPQLAAVALVDARTAAATGGMGISWWHARMRDGSAPQPVLRATRCTRWRASDVAEFWRNFPATSGRSEA